jgi:XTP/dITP diphosphohydrolase
VEALLLATSNPGKVRELRRLLEGVPYRILMPQDLALQLDVEEDGATYAENALKKARAYSAASQCLALADDSGLEVDALGGEPSVHSARYGGHGLDDAARTRRLLAALEGVAPSRRTARFRAVVALAWPSGREETFEGVLEGAISAAPRGVSGFGYDPVFELPHGRTVAELDQLEKDRISHRGIAARLARARLLQAGVPR